MSALVGLTRDEQHRYRWNDGALVPGITTVQGMKDKSAALVGWAKRETAACAVRNLEMLTAMVAAGGPDSAITWLKNIPDYQRDASADIGTRVHAVAEAIGLGHEVTVADDEAPFIEAYRRDFLERYKPEFVAVEFMVYSERHRYGGTGDAIVRIDGELWIIDYKTSNAIYPETALQLAALRWADWIGRPGDPTKFAIPQATRFGVVHVRPEGAALHEYAVTKADFECFVACRRLHAWVQERAPYIKRPVYTSREQAA